MEWWTCVIFLCVTAVLADDEWLNVTIAQGPVRGRKHPSGDLYAFYNIPYATAPVGVNKFKAPLPPPTWEQPFEATDDEIVICPQNRQYGDLPYTLVTKEDCLIANVFVPDTEEKNLTVLVYIHGGGYLMGYGRMNQGTQLLKQKKDFIMVTFNYRMSIHGFLCLGTEDAPGNAGMKDQLALLRWVQENIASFGGNPDDVTIAGCSAGSTSVELMMLSKPAEGLFHRLIYESAGNSGASVVQRDPLDNAKSHARSLNFTNVDDILALERFYKNLPMDLLLAYPHFDLIDSTFFFSPCVERDTGDGAFLTESPISILKNGEYKKLPMLYGVTEMEGLIRIGFFEIWKDMMNEKFSDFLPGALKFESDEEKEEVADKVKTYYFGDNPVSNDNILKFVDFFSDVMIKYPMLWAARLYAEAGHNEIYLYEYSFVDDNTPLVPHTNVRGAGHCFQSMAWLDNVDGTDESLETPEYQNLRRIVRELWHNFIKTGKPVSEGSSLLAWPAAGADLSPYMVLDENLALGGVLSENITQFWDEIYQKHYQDPVPLPMPHSGADSAMQQNVFNLIVLYFLFYLIKGIMVE